MDIRAITDLLDNSQDAETIALEIVSHETLYNNLGFLYLASKATACYPPDVDEAIAITIRELWDIAYSHGYYDGKTEAEEGIV